MIEVMSPAGSFEALAAAIKAGAGSIYFGAGNLNMRSRSSANFSLDDIKKIAKICFESNVKSYLTLNTVLYDNDLNEMKQICDAALDAKVSAVIASDISVISYARSIGLEIHISTQCNVSNFEAVKFYSKFADVIVLARELSLEQIREICEKIKSENVRGPLGELVKIELFIHGALCVSISGKCYMSLATYNRSANRGACLQNCRRSYRVIDDETGDELKIENKYVMSPKDLCTIEHLDKIISSGVSVLKIEGRGRSADYVYTVTKVYGEAIKSIQDKTYTKEKAKVWKEELMRVFNRGFWEGGYYLGLKDSEWSNSYGSKATTQKVFVGNVKNYYLKAKVAEIYINTKEINVGDLILIEGPTSGVVKFKLESMKVNEVESSKAKKGDSLTVKISERVRENDQVYVIKDRFDSQ